MATLTKWRARIEQLFAAFYLSTVQERRQETTSSLLHVLCLWISCLWSEELLTEMMNSSVTQDMLNTNSFRVVSAVHLSLGHTLQDSTECHVKEEPSGVISDAELEQLYTEDIVTEVLEEQSGLIDNYQSSHLEDPNNIKKEEADDVETDAEYINLEDENIKIEENGWEPNIIGWEPDIADPSSQFTDNICPKIVKVVLERIDQNGPWVGARVSKKPKIAALKDTEDATTNKRKKEVIKNKQTETITIKEPKIVTKKIEVEKPATASKILKTCDKADINLNKCDDNVLISGVNDVCGQKSTNDSFLELNASSISSRKYKPFSCDSCNKSFSSIHNLNVHIRTHTGDKPYQCNICKKCFGYKNVLKNHIFTHTSSDKPYQCNACNKCFSLKHNLKDHIRTHTGDKPYQCNVCKKYFIRKNHLQRHAFIHTCDKPYKCNVCKKCFYSKYKLKVHIRTHTSDKPYQCNVCNKCFSYKYHLKDHIRTHTGDKPYQCNVCKKYFIRKSHLQRHVFVHTSVKPYKCNVCKKCYSDSSSYSFHIRIHKH